MGSHIFVLLFSIVLLEIVCATPITVRDEDGTSRDIYAVIKQVAENRMAMTVWSNHWEESGWSPHVVDASEVARKHPDFPKLARALDGARITPDQRWLFEKWLAMAQLGGGWMADTDLYPLRNFSADYGANITVYEAISPALVSGSAEAYRSMAFALVETANDPHNHGNTKFNFWTDTLGLVNLFHDKRVQAVRRVIPGDKVLDGGCNRVPKKAWAVHFSTITLLRSKSLLPDERWAENRTVVADRWLNNWKNNCQEVTAVEK